MTFTQKPSTGATRVVTVPSYTMTSETRRDDDRQAFVTTFTLHPCAPYRQVIVPARGDPEEQA